MNPNTGEIKDYSEIDEKLKQLYQPLSEEQLKEVEGMTSEERRAWAVKNLGPSPDTFIVDQDEETKFVDSPAGPSIGIISPGQNEFDITWMNRKQRRKLMRDFKLSLTDEKKVKPSSEDELKRRRKFRKKNGLKVSE